jgi:hypothetical protein
MNRRTRFVLAAVAVSAVLVPAVSVAAITRGSTPAAVEAPTVAAAAVPDAVVVSPDPARDLYTGTGGLVIPAANWTGDPGTRQATAQCTDCSWRVSLLCTKADLAAGKCRRLNLGCPVGTQAVRIWLQHGSGPWEIVGQSCQGPQPPRTVDDVGRQVRDRAEAALPPLRATAQPADAALVRVPVVFGTGQSATGLVGADLSVIGLAVSLDSRVRWHWTFGDGTDLWTARPGGRYPDTSVSHTYRRAGTVQPSVEAVWRAQYVVEGLGPFDVPGPLLTQTQALSVVVRAAHASLVS